MATLPDIDTTTTGWICYWNAIDQGGVNDIDPVEATSALNNYTTYDNGVEGVRNGGSGYNITFRVKEDGWVVGYIDRQNNYGYRVSTAYHGAWDTFDHIFDRNTSTHATNDRLSSHINTIRSQFSNSGNMTWSPADVGIWSPQYDNATTVTVLARSGNTSGDAQYGYNSGTSLYHYSIVGIANMHVSNFSYYGGTQIYHDPSSTTIAGTYNEGSDTRWCHINVLNNGTFDPGGGNTHNLSFYGDESYDYSGNIVAAWA